MARRIAAVVVATLAVAAASPAQAGLLEIAVQQLTAQVPECQDGGVLETIQSRFLHADAHVLKRNLAIVGLEKVRQTDLWVGRPSPVVRRYCQARVALNDGRWSQLYYLIEQNQGFVGVGWNVEFCISGYEPWRVHDGACRTVRKWW